METDTEVRINNGVYRLFLFVFLILLAIPLIDQSWFTLLHAVFG